MFTLSGILILFIILTILLGVFGLSRLIIWLGGDDQYRGLH